MITKVFQINLGYRDMQRSDKNRDVTLNRVILHLLYHSVIDRAMGRLLKSLETRN